ncbi:MAG: HTH-type transcriptional repressor YvoA [Eubacteriales bacterium]|jgi:GntR family transcriptional regulator
MSNLPLYQELHDHILRYINSHEYPENGLLPSERDMCQMYKVSRSTVRQALALLEEENMVYTIHGIGTFVKPKVFEQNLSQFYSFTDAFKKMNISFYNRVLSYETLIPGRSLALKLKADRKVAYHKLVRLCSARDYPLIIETTYLPKNRFVHIDVDATENQSLYDYLSAKYGLKVDHATETFVPILPDSEQCELLKISPRIPCLQLERFSYEDDCLVEYTTSVVRGDKYVFKIELNNQNNQK